MDSFPRLLCATLLLILQAGEAEGLETVWVGDPFTLTIDYDEIPKGIIWTVNGTLIADRMDTALWVKENYRDRLTVGDRNITISNSSVLDSGIYSAKVNNGSAVFYYFNFDVIVKEKVVVIESDDSGIYNTGEIISLTLRYEGPPEEVIWFINDVLIYLKHPPLEYLALAYRDRTFINENGSLTMTNTTGNDAGNYTVSIKTSFASGSRYFQVDFYDPVVDVTLQQSPAIVQEGISNVNLSCKAASGGGSVEWTKNGLPLGDVTFQLLDGNRTLQIINPKRDFTGNYSCNISNPLYWNSASIFMTVYYPVKGVTIQQTPEIADESTPNVKLSCNAADGLGEVTWQKEGETLNIVSPFELQDNNRTLQINNPNRTFSGNYSCNMSNLISWEVGFRFLTIYYPVINVTLLQSPEIVAEGTPEVNLSCKADSGFGSVLWEKNGQPLNDSKYNLLDEGQTLQIVLPDRTSTGSYSCNMSNPISSGVDSVMMTVYYPIVNLSISQSPEVVAEGSPNVTLLCVVDDGIGDVSWQKNGQPLEGNDYQLLDGDHLLLITNPYRNFTGKYTCNISNPVNWAAGSKDLTVYYPVSGVTVTQSPNDVTEKTASVELTCSASSNNGEAVTWRKDTVLVSSNATHSFPKADVLRISSPKKAYSGIYNCNVSNAVYSDTGSLNLTISGANDVALHGLNLVTILMTSFLVGILSLS